MAAAACARGALTIEGNNYSRNLAYYVIAHASKFVSPGSVRISSTQPDQVSDVAFRTPAGKTVLIVANNAGEHQLFAVQIAGKSFSASLDAGAVGTYIW